MKMKFDFATKKFMITILLIVFTLYMFWVGKVANPELALDFIKWVFITYCGADVGEKLVGAISNGKK